MGKTTAATKKKKAERRAAADRQQAQDLAASLQPHENTWRVATREERRNMVISLTAELSDDGVGTTALSEVCGMLLYGVWHCVNAADVP